MSWSNPNPSPTYAELMRSASFGGGGGVSGLTHPLPNQWAQAGQQVISSAAQLMAQRKREQIAQTLLDHASYDSNNGQGDPLARSLNESSMSPGDAWTAYQHQREYDAQQLNEQIKQQQLARVQSSLDQKNNAINAPIVDEKTGMIFNGHEWVHPVKAASARVPAEQQDPWEKTIAVARGKLDEGGNFTNKYPEAATGDQVLLRTPQGKEITVPWSSYAERTGAAEPQTTGKKLDETTAAAILKEAGGDPDKARELARQRGYAF